MKNLFTVMVLATMFTGVVIAPFGLATPVGAESAATQILNGAGEAAGPEASTGANANVGNVFVKIVNTILFVLGAIAVIMIIIGGIRYVVSGGDGSSVTAAKNTILYAVIGLIVAILAFAIVNFVAKSFGA